MNKKIFYIIIIIASMFFIAGLSIIILQTKKDGVNVNILPDDSIGGATKYEVTGVKSEIEANKAIIEKVYNGDGVFRAITNHESQDIANKISVDGCGQISKSYTLGPPVDDAVNWTNFSNDNYDDIVVYMLDDKYLVHTDCPGRQ